MYSYMLISRYLKSMGMILTVVNEPVLKLAICCWTWPLYVFQKNRKTTAPNRSGCYRDSLPDSHSISITPHTQDLQHSNKYSSC
ncbi:hypothetical protein K445DRAFT_184513 [Daldinia sp. EC12]|nr:hypothetical protein K445DRAFT_184513 [Daldinia sp. EC12]